MQVFFWITFTVLKCSYFMFCHKNKAFPFLHAKKMQQEPGKAAPALGSGQPKNPLRLHPKSGGSRRLWLCNTADAEPVYNT